MPAPPPLLVLDTNTVMALWLFKDATLRPLADAIAQRHCRLATRADALAELRCVLGYSHFGLTPEQRAALAEHYAASCSVIAQGRDKQVPDARNDAGKTLAQHGMSGEELMQLSGPQADLGAAPSAATGADALPPCRDPDDQKFLQIALATGACQLLTRDKLLLKLARHRLVKPHFRILTPEAWCREYSPAATEDPQR